MANFNWGCLSDSDVRWIDILNTGNRHDAQPKIKESSDDREPGFFIDLACNFSIRFESNEHKQLFITSCSVDIQKYLLPNLKGEDSVLRFNPNYLGLDHTHLDFTNDKPLDLKETKAIPSKIISFDFTDTIVANFNGDYKTSLCPNDLLDGRDNQSARIRPSRGPGDTGFYIAKRGELAINFTSEEDKINFKKSCDINIESHILPSYESQKSSLYFKKGSLGPDHTHLDLLDHNTLEDSVLGILGSQYDSDNV